MSGFSSRSGRLLRVGDLLENRESRVALKRRLPGAHLVEHDAQTEQIGPRIAAFAIACSGAIYSGVPDTKPVRVSFTSSAMRARPNRSA